MRTNIDIDDALMAEALAATGAKTKREVVEAGLRSLVERQEQIKRQRAAFEEAMKWRGKLQWEGDLDAMRLD